MRALVVFCHPRQDSFSASVRDAAVRGLRDAGHSVEVLDLHALGFDPVMSASELTTYQAGEPLLDPMLVASADAVRAAQILVFVYPTWWSGLPAMLKGWLERTMAPGVAFVFDDRHRVRPALGHIRRVVGITSYGSSRRDVRVINDNGRRILTRALRLNTGWRTRRTWLGLYALDTRTHDERRAFLERVERRMATL